MKKVILLAVIVSLLSGCGSTKKRTAQESQVTINTVVSPGINGTQNVSISTNAPGNNGYNLNVSVNPGSIKTESKLLTNPNTSVNTPKLDGTIDNVWYSSNTKSNDVIIKEKPLVIDKKDVSRAKIDPNTNKVIWIN